MEPILDMRAQALRQLPAQYRGKPLIEAFVGAIADEVQGVEADRIALMTAAELANAAGVWLANMEALVGAPATAYGEAERRVIVAAKAVINASHCTPADVRAALSALGLRWAADYFRHGSVTVTGGPPGFPAVDLIASLLKQATAAGEGLRVQIDTGIALPDQDLWGKSAAPWSVVTGDGAITKGTGVLTFAGKQGAQVEATVDLVTGGEYTFSGDFMGDLSLELSLGGYGLVGVLAPASTWTPFAFDFIAGASGGTPSTPVDVLGSWSLRNVKIAPKGRVDRSLRATDASLGQHQADPNGATSTTSIASSLIGGFAFHEVVAA